MPTYEYACKACEEHLEVVHSFNDPAPNACPSCGGNLRKVFGSVGISFKGSGFYRNDARSSSSGSANKSSSGGTPSSNRASAEAPKPSSTDSAKTSAPAPAA